MQIDAKLSKQGNNIHPSAVISDGAQIGENVSMGPFCVIGSNVIIGDDVVLHSHVVIEGKTTIGRGTKIFPFSSIGHESQDFKENSQDSAVIIGENNVIREYVTIQPGTEGSMETIVGNNCLLMVSAHVAHDCKLGDHVILANNATLAGHVTVDDHAILGGLVAVHQRVRIGAHAMIGGMSGVENDVIPYGMVFGERAKLKGINLVGLKRRGFKKNEIHALLKIYNRFFVDREELQSIIGSVTEQYGDSDAIKALLDFINKHEGSRRPLCQPV